MKASICKIPFSSSGQKHLRSFFEQFLRLIFRLSKVSEDVSPEPTKMVRNYCSVPNCDATKAEYQMFHTPKGETEFTGCDITLDSHNLTLLLQTPTLVGDGRR